MALGQQTGHGSALEVIAEAKRIFELGLLSRTDDMSLKEANFVKQMYALVEDGTIPITGKQLLWLRALKDRYCI
jgi:hypothetical protein